MTVWQATRMTRWSTKLVIATVLLAVLLVAAVPVALVASVIMMLIGHIVAGLALAALSIVAATIAVVVASKSGVRHLRKHLIQPARRVVQLRRNDYSYDSSGSYDDGQQLLLGPNRRTL